MKNYLKKQINHKFIEYLLVLTIFMSVISSNIFAVNISTMGLDPSLMDTYLAEDESQNNEVKKVIDNFILKYITPNMTDFEKEIQIIKYLVATTSYDEDEELNTTPVITDSYKAYGALINGKATCSGYAKAFDLLAKSCNLSSIVVTGSARNSKGIEAPHAWNQIYLDNDWYNVDVTWEDPNTNVEVGFNQLFNNYINGTEKDFATNHFRENGHECTATKYGKNFVAYYLHTGFLNFNGKLDDVRKSYEKQIAEFTFLDKKDEAEKVLEKLLLLGAKYDDNTNLFLTNDDNVINTYILSKVISGENVVSIVTGANTENTLGIDKNDWLEKNMKIEGRIRMNKIYSTDGETDTRILIFKID